MAATREGPVIERASRSDLPALATLFEAYRAFYRRPPDRAAVERFLEERLERGDSVIFVARLDGSAVGFTQLYPIFSSLLVGRAFILNDLYVAEAARGRGVGRALLDRAVAHGRAVGAVYLELATETSNLEAQRLYEAAGWSRESGFYHYSFELG